MKTNNLHNDNQQSTDVNYLNTPVNNAQYILSYSAHVIKTLLWSINSVETLD